GFNSSTVSVWDLLTRRQRYHWAQTGTAYAVATAHHRGRPLVIVATGSTAHVWALADRGALGELAGHTAAITHLCVDNLAGAAFLLTGSQDGSARLWDLDTMAPLGPPLTGDDELLAAAALRAVNGMLTAYIGYDEGTIRTWDPVTGAPAPEPPVPPLDGRVHVLTAGEMHGRQVLVAGSDRTIRLWSVTGNRQVAEIQIGMTPQDVQLTPDGYLCIATVMGIAVLHVPDWGSAGPARETVG